ncbi:hypothetical protein KQ306_05505 [Synechococcus sp. CS-1324]|uniref:hypothetical protein n=1 Tax=Synechococcus sp. CS-1324 TaxID=2847980 RepID=UPI000DB3FB1C|nr:hypothetical protein [Synechococcus sp. CS-1324]MCT0230317.1 hypothetical protein [Synechococcus sp. CS-1324]PZV03975.1 MAG: hypothetical protein DCF23_07800 [Cyanobium sp.]
MPSAGAQRPPRRRQPAAEAPLPPRRHWLVPLLVGLCFGLGYAITDRLLSRGGDATQPLGLDFGVKPFPGTSLESLRMRFGTDRTEIRGDLDRLEFEANQKQEEAKRRRQELEDRQAAEEAATRPAAAEDPPFEPLLPPEAAPAEPGPPEPQPPAQAPAPLAPPPPTPLP